MTEAPLLPRLDSGRDALENRVRAEVERIDPLIQWNPRRTAPAAVLAQAESLKAEVAVTRNAACRPRGRGAGPAIPGTADPLGLGLSNERLRSRRLGRSLVSGQRK